MVVRMLGGEIEFTAEERGTAFLRGRGVYVINGHPGRWGLEDVRPGLAPEE